MASSMSHILTSGLERKVKFASQSGKGDLQKAQQQAGEKKHKNFGWGTGGEEQPSRARDWLAGVRLRPERSR